MGDGIVFAGVTIDEVVGEHALPGFTWTVLRDPHGNEFCVVSAES